MRSTLYIYSIKLIVLQITLIIIFCYFLNYPQKITFGVESFEKCFGRLEYNAKVHKSHLCLDVFKKYV